MHRKTLIIISFLLLFLALAASAFSTTPKEIGTETKEPINFNLIDIYGKRHAISDYRGKVVFLNFWATWCEPCRMEMPSIQTMYEESDKDKFVILAVSVGEPVKTVQDFIARRNYSFIVLLDQKSKIAKHFRIYSIPTTFILDKEGRIIKETRGARDWFWRDIEPLVK